jgi:Xaa-Pro dipeptidase
VLTEIWKNRLGASFHKRNVEKIQNVLVKRDLDAILIVNPINVYYATGFHAPIWERPTVLMIPQSDEPILMVSANKEGEARAQVYTVKDENILVYAEYPYSTPSTIQPDLKWVTPEPTLKWACRQIEKAGFVGKTVGVEDNYTDLMDSACENWFDQICRYLDARIVKAGTLVMELRSIKEPEEIAFIRKACEYGDLSEKNLSEAIEPGLTEREITDKARAKTMEFIKKEMHLGGSVNFTEVDVNFGAKAADAIHGGFLGPSGDYKVKEGDVGWINSVCSVWLYHGESERCGVVGKPTEKQWKMFNIAMESQLRAREAIKPGVTCSEVDKAAIDVIKGAGFIVRTGVGHSIGLQDHEPPYLRIGNDVVLRPGMCFTVEPGNFVPGVGAFHNSDTILVTDDGYEPLTKWDGLHRFLLP